MNKFLLIILTVLVLATVILGGIYLSISKSGRSVSETIRETFTLSKASPAVVVDTPSPTPRTIKSLPSGRQEYNISHGAEVKGPKPFKAVINPLTPKKGEKQTVQLSITSDADVTDAKIILHTDNNKKEYPLSLIDGNKQNGIWEASWTMDDAYDYNYYIQFYLKSANGLFDDGLRFRQEW